MDAPNVRRFVHASALGARRRLVSSARAIVLMALAGLGPAVSAQAPSSEPGIFTEVLDVRVVNIEVVVTDKKGVRVHDLAPEDFAITIDGQDVPVEFFTEVLGGRSIAPGASSGTVPALAPGEPVGTSFLVFIDDFYAIRRDRNRILDHVIEQLPRLGPQDRMAVVAFDGKSLEMLSSWSQTPETLARVLTAAKERASGGLQRIAEQRNFRATRNLLGENDPLGRGALGVVPELALDEEDEALRIAEHMKRIVLAASSALRGFANPPGRKVMMLLSGGWPYNPAQWVVNEPFRTAYSTRIPSGQDIYRQLVDTANRLSYTLYTADLPLFAQSTSLLDASAATGPGTGTTLEFERERELELTLRELARQTGGRAMINSNANTLFERVLDDTRSYYWLGFTPTWQGDDQGHDIDIIVRRPGLDVRFRRSFSDLSRSTEVSMMVESTLLFGSTAGTEGLPTELGDPTGAGIGKVMVPFRVGIPVHEVSFLPTAEGFSAALELRIAVIDSRGNRAEIPVIPLELRVEDEPEGQAFSVYESALKMRKRPHRLVFSLYDSVSGKIISSVIDYDPNAFKKTRRSRATG